MPEFLSRQFILARTLSLSWTCSKHMRTGGQLLTSTLVQVNLWASTRHISLPSPSLVLIIMEIVFTNCSEDSPSWVETLDIRHEKQQLRKSKLNRKCTALIAETEKFVIHLLFNFGHFCHLEFWYSFVPRPVNGIFVSLKQKM